MSQKMHRSKTLDLDGITIHLTRKKMKNVRMRVNEKGQVLVSAPFTVSEEQIIQFILKKRSWIVEQQANIQKSIMARANNATPEEVQEWMEVIRACTPPLVQYWESVLGVKVTKLVYRNMKSRWGSCQPSTGRVCINTRLALFPPECLEYVVLHELCHFFHPNHGPSFKKMLDTYMPEWRSIQQKLSQ